MSGKRRAVEKSVEEILIDLMAKKFMSVAIQASRLEDFKHPPQLHVSLVEP
jgi:hypothetical protein